MNLNRLQEETAGKRFIHSASCQNQRIKCRSIFFVAKPKIISIRHLEKVKQRFPLIGAFIVCIEEIAWNLSYVAKSACPAPGMNLEAIGSPIQTPLPKLCGLPFWNL